LHRVHWRCVGGSVVVSCVASFTCLGNREKMLHKICWSRIYADYLARTISGGMVRVRGRCNVRLKMRRALLFDKQQNRRKARQR
jgi:hypothetical protein